MTDFFKLPVSSYEELVKIIKAYGNGKVGVPISLNELEKSSGMSKYILSKNNGFLIQVELITKGVKKSPTDNCKKLANAYSMKIEEEISSIWKNILNKDDFIASMISVVSVKGSIAREDFINHIVYSASCGNSSNYKTGAATIIEILKLTGMVDEDNGYITLDESNNNPYIVDTDDSLNSIGENKKNSITSLKVNEEMQNKEAKLFVQQYTCESGQIAKIVIPESATEDDLLGFRDMLNIAIKRKFKINVDEC